MSTELNNWDWLYSKKGRVNYRATFKSCPDCGNIEFDPDYPNCLHCLECGWTACMYTDPELEKLAGRLGVEVIYVPK